MSLLTAFEVGGGGHFPRLLINNFGLIGDVAVRLWSRNVPICKIIYEIDYRFVYIQYDRPSHAPELNRHDPSSSREEHVRGVLSMLFDPSWKRKRTFYCFFSCTRNFFLIGRFSVTSLWYWTKCPSKTHILSELVSAGNLVKGRLSGRTNVY